jgi:hypothetical protein
MTTPASPLVNQAAAAAPVAAAPVAPAMPAQTPPDLSNLAQPAMTPTQAAEDYRQKGQGQAYAAAQTDADAIQKLNAPAPPAANVPHARLLAMIQGIGIGLSSFGTAMGTHGKEGGAPEVEDFYAKQQEQKLQKQQAAQSIKNQQVQNLTTALDTNLKLGTAWNLLASTPDETELRHLDVAGKRVSVIGETQDVRTKALQDFIATGDVDAYNSTISQLGGAATPAGTAPTATGTAPAAAGVSGTAPAGAASTAGAPVVGKSVASLPPVVLSAWKNSTDAASSAYPNDPDIKAAAAVIANPNSAPTAMAQAARSAQNRMNSLDTGVKSQTAQTSLAKAQQELSAGNRPKDLNDAVGRLTAAQQAYAAAPTPANQLAVDNAKQARANFLSAEASDARVKQAAQDGDPNLLAQGLVNGDVAWSQVVSTRRPEFATAAFAAADKLSMAQTGQHFSATINETNFKQATNPQLQMKLKMVEGMTEKGGSIDIAQTAASKLPGVNEKTANKVFNVVSGELGDTAITNFHTAMLGLADEYSQVMGTGGGSDVSRQQALDILHDGYSKGQLAGSIAVMKSDIAARRRGLIGGNQTLQKLFPDPTAQQPSPQQNTNPYGAVPR